MVTIEKSQWDHSGHVTRFEALVEIDKSPSALAADYVATVAGYIDATFDCVRITSLSSVRPLEAIVILAHIAEREQFIISEAKRLEQVV